MNLTSGQRAEGGRSAHRNADRRAQESGLCRPHDPRRPVAVLCGIGEHEHCRATWCAHPRHPKAAT